MHNSANLLLQRGLRHHLTPPCSKDQIVRAQSDLANAPNYMVANRTVELLNMLFGDAKAEGYVTNLMEKSLLISPVEWAAESEFVYRLFSSKAVIHRVLQTYSNSIVSAEIYEWRGDGVDDQPRTTNLYRWVWLRIILNGIKFSNRDYPVEDKKLDLLHYELVRNPCLMILHSHILELRGLKRQQLLELFCQTVCHPLDGRAVLGSSISCNRLLAIYLLVYLVRGDSGSSREQLAGFIQQAIQQYEFYGSQNSLGLFVRVWLFWSASTLHYEQRIIDDSLHKANISDGWYFLALNDQQNVTPLSQLQQPSFERLVESYKASCLWNSSYFNLHSLRLLMKAGEDFIGQPGSSCRSTLRSAIQAFRVYPSINLKTELDLLGETVVEKKSKIVAPINSVKNHCSLLTRLNIRPIDPWEEPLRTNELLSLYWLSYGVAWLLDSFRKAPRGKYPQWNFRPLSHPIVPIAFLLLVFVFTRCL